MRVRVVNIVDLEEIRPVAPRDLRLARHEFARLLASHGDLCRSGPQRDCESLREAENRAFVAALSTDAGLDGNFP